MTYSTAIINRISELCAKKGISINRLAVLSGVTQSTIDAIMKGKNKNPTIRTLHRLAVGLDMTVSEFLNFPEMNQTYLDQ